MLARDIMQTEFDTLSPGDTIAAAVRHFKPVDGANRRRVFGLMVTDEDDHLAGMLSMYDILLFIQPKHAPIWGEMEDVDPSELYERSLEADNLVQVIEGLTTQRLGAVLIRNPSGNAVGVVSKTDLIVAYKHGMAVEAAAAEVMSQPVVSCGEESDLALAIQRMLIRDVQRLFVHSVTPARITGILSLSDAARFRSGSCRACTSSRLIR